LHSFDGDFKPIMDHEINMSPAKFMPVPRGKACISIVTLFRHQHYGRKPQ
jgi:hypothetical protein